MGWLSVGKVFIKPFTKTGAKSVGQWKSGAAKAKLKMTKENLEQTFKESDKVLKNLEKQSKNKRRYWINNGKP